MQNNPKGLGGIKATTINITYKGKTYSICNSGQFRYLKKLAMPQVIAKLNEEKIDATDEVVSKKSEETVLSSGFATLEMVLNKMTPSERKQWKNSYRFCGISSSSRKEEY